jgi:hypothetical protein
MSTATHFFRRKRKHRTRDICTRNDIMKITTTLASNCHSCHHFASDQCLLTKESMEIIKSLNMLVGTCSSEMCVICASCRYKQQYGDKRLLEQLNYDRLLELSLESTSDFFISPREELQLRKWLLLRKKEEEEVCSSCFCDFERKYAYCFHFHYDDLSNRIRDPLSMMKYISKYTVQEYMNELDKCCMFCSTCYLQRLFRHYGDDNFWKCISIVNRMVEQSLF